MTGRTFLTLSAGLVLTLPYVAHADDFRGVRPRVKLFSSIVGAYAFKTLAEGSGNSSDGIFFMLVENGKEKVIWRTKLVNNPSRAIVVESGKYVVTLDSWRRIGFEHCLVVYGEKGKLIADFKLEELLTAGEIKRLPTEVPARSWSDKDIAACVDRSIEEKMIVIRLKYKDWAKVICLSLASGRIAKE
jgi:hypothetical protein